MARQIVVEVAGSSKGFQQATKEATEHAGKFGGAMHGIASGIGLGLFNMASAAVMGFVGQIQASGQAFRDDQVSQLHLQNTIKNTVKNYKDGQKSAEDFAGSQARLGFQDDDVRESLATLVGITHNVKDAQADSAIAMDLARAKGIDLATATDIVAKAAQGNGKALKGLGIDIGKAKTGAEFLNAIQKNVKGSAEAWAKTSEGKLAVAQAKNAESWEKIGAVVDRVQGVVLPLVADAFEKVTNSIQPVIDTVTNFLNKNQLMQPVLYGVAAVLGVVAIAAGVLAVEAVLAFLPFIAIIAAVGLAVAGLKYAWDHNLGDIQGKTQAVLSVVVPIFTVIKDWLAKHLPEAISGLKNFFTSIGPTFSAVGTTVRKVWDGITGTVKGAINTIIGSINSFIAAIDKIQIHVPSVLGSPKYDWNGLNIKPIPYLHSGGVVPGPPGADVLTMLQAGETVTKAGQASGGHEIHIHMHGTVIDGPAMDRFFREGLQRARYAKGR